METAKLVNDEGLICLAAFVAPQAANRELAAELIGRDRFLVVHCAAPLAHCQATDSTGLYAEAAERDITGIPGVDFEYEVPTDADLVLPTHQIDYEESVNRILALLRSRGLLR